MALAPSCVFSVGENSAYIRKRVIDKVLHHLVTVVR